MYWKATAKTSSLSNLWFKEIYPNSEILASTDERFRPVNLHTAPDGTVYIVDMYHGILQHKEFLTSYLRKQILSRGLDKNNNTMGRIYRLRWKANKAGKQARMLGESPAELVKYLAHPNGWWRDTARRLIVQVQDKSIVPAITTLIKGNTDHRAQINALWTLYGLNAVNIESVLIGIKSKHNKVKISAIAVSERLAQSHHKIIASQLNQLANSDYEVALQVALSAGSIKGTESLLALKAILKKYGDKKYIREAAISGLTGRESEFKKVLGDFSDKKFLAMLDRLDKKKKPTDNFHKLSKSDQELFKKGKTLYFGKAACFGCHGPKGKGQANMVPQLAKSDWVTGDPKRLIKVMLHGLSGPITLNKKVFKTVMVMPGMAANKHLSDKDLAAIATYMRNSWGNQATPLKAKDFTKIRQSTINRKLPYTENNLK